MSFMNLFFDWSMICNYTHTNWYNHNNDNDNQNNQKNPKKEPEKQNNFTLVDIVFNIGQIFLIYLCLACYTWWWHFFFWLLSQKMRWNTHTQPLCHYLRTRSMNDGSVFPPPVFSSFSHFTWDRYEERERKWKRPLDWSITLYMAKNIIIILT